MKRIFKTVLTATLIVTGFTAEANAVGLGLTRVLKTENLWSPASISTAISPASNDMTDSGSAPLQLMAMMAFRA